jgi:hypothetical protein
VRYTLLELTQSVLASIDGDEANSITDTVEAHDIALMIRDIYFDIVSRANLPENFFFFGLDASTDEDKPTLMTLPETASNLLWMRYDIRLVGETKPDFIDMQYVDFKEFIDGQHMLNADEDNVSSFVLTENGESMTHYYRTDAHPARYTSYNDHTFLFDSFDNTIENTLQKSKSLCYGERIIPFTLEDSFVPSLDSRQFSVLLNEAKATAWTEKKQSANQKAEQNARRAWRNIERSKHNVGTENVYQKITYDFGRK